MTTFLVFSITRAKEIDMDIHEIDDSEISDPWEYVKSAITPPYLGECIVVKQDDVRRFKLRCNVVEK
jgi:hypothetical protein